MIISTAITYGLATDCRTCTAAIGERCSMRSSNLPMHSSRLLRGEALRRRDVAVAAALLSDRQRDRDIVLKEPCPVCLAAPQEPCHLYVGRFHEERVDRSSAGDRGPHR
jgi:hypothetical protein